MADTLGVIASAIQLVDTALKAREYVKAFVNASHEQRQLFSEIDSLKPLLKELQNRVLEHPSPSRNSFQQMIAPLNRFQATMEDLTKKLAPAGGRWSKFSKQLAWTLWNKKEAKEYFEEFERIKLLLNTWLVLDIWHVGQHQRQDIDHKQKSSVAGNRELVTGSSKMLNSKPGNLVWGELYGVMGYTVLASMVVHHLRSQFQGENIGVAWIYLNHKETDIQSPSNLLASLWRQLVFRKPISLEILTLHALHHEQRTRPTLNEIYSQLSSAVAEYLKVYIIVDALDEYPEDRRSILLESLAKIEPTSWRFAQLEDDIRCYVEKQIQRSVRLSRHLTARPEIKDEIEKKFVRNVDGMFLLAKLHMDSLATKSTIRALRDALDNMPKDLEHTYDEAMERIDLQSEEDIKIARLVLSWISNPKRPLSLRELQEALAMEPGDTTFPDDNVLDADYMLSVCAWLVIVDQTDHINWGYESPQHLKY
ncbi:hypothetical protein FB451DRAFT_1390903 [Mycena latifolia]|nr:hypothetical protein FB451DRAFT_1390903 [Mycena latifolia]